MLSRQTVLTSSNTLLALTQTVRTRTLARLCLKAAMVEMVGAAAETAAETVVVMEAETAAGTAAVKVKVVRAKAEKAPPVKVLPGTAIPAALLLAMRPADLAAVLVTQADRPQVTPRVALAVALAKAKLGRAKQAKVKLAKVKVKVKTAKAKATTPQPTLAAIQTRL